MDNLIAKSIGWGENRGYLRATRSRLQSRTAAVVLTRLPAGRDRRPNCYDAIFQTTETALRRS
jgi:hypothetical protein